MKDIINHMALQKRLVLLVIFCTALIFRIILINFYQIDKIATDAIGYHTLALNLADGKGLSLDQKPPFQKYFFREPGYPVFLSIWYKAYSLLVDTPVYIAEYHVDSSTYDAINHKEILFVKYIQAILDALACILFFLLISNILNSRYAFIIAFAFCFYYPYAVYTTNILRETLQSFLALSMCYALLQYFNHNKNKYLILTGILWGLLTLTFQVSQVFVLSIPLFIWIYKKSFIQAVKPSIIILVVMILTVSPWLIRTYSNYPDIRVLKSFGTSFTPELRNYTDAVTKAESFGLINKKQMDSIFTVNWYNLSDKEKFNLSWDGTITQRADSLNALVHEPIISKRKIKKYGTYFYKAWFPTKFLDISTKELISTRPIFAALLITPIMIISLFAFVGLLKFYSRFFKINIVFTTFMVLFFIISTEYRRMLPALPFVFLYGILGIIFVYKKLITKMKVAEIEEVLFK